ncbi:MAG: TlpA disulfide reductase family protein [Phycisphaerae bacterium]|nr:TlpA disulfide reductase family protein [Phycisphaerae bacterium]
MRLSRITEFGIDAPLADRDWSAPPRTDGMWISDNRVDPPVEWTHPNEPSDAEKQRRSAELARQMAESRKRHAAIDELVGTPSPDFPKAEPGGAQWLGSRPLTSADLKGNVTIVVFFATWCGPCRQELVHSRALIARDTPAGAESTPDVPDPARASFGVLASAFRVHGIPRAFLINRDGLIVAHGGLSWLHDEAKNLAAQPMAAAP